MKSERSHVKLYTKNRSHCLICVKRVGPCGSREPQKQDTTSFMNALKDRKHYNGISITEYSEYIDFENNPWKTNMKGKVICKLFKGYT